MRPPAEFTHVASEVDGSLSSRKGASCTRPDKSPETIVVESSGKSCSSKRSPDGDDTSGGETTTLVAVRPPKRRWREKTHVKKHKVTSTRIPTPRWF